MEVYAEPTDLVYFQVRSPGYSGSAKSAIGPWEDTIYFYIFNINVKSFPLRDFQGRLCSYSQRDVFQFCSSLSSLAHS